ncbi:MAG TPA: hypothetical protein VMH05_02785, partial [Bryobacteraceae bacterium]|nr:hypothetical protein [Bryobacteraceae bacterium]
TEAGEIHPFMPGVGLIASRLYLPVVPIRLKGVHRVWNRAKLFPRPGQVEVAIGAPLPLQGESYPALARKLEETIRTLN